MRCARPSTRTGTTGSRSRRIPFPSPLFPGYLGRVWPFRVDVIRRGHEPHVLLYGFSVLSEDSVNPRCSCRACSSPSGLRRMDGVLRPRLAHVLRVPDHPAAHGGTDTLPRLSTPFVVHVREAGGARCSSAAASTSTRPRTRFSSPKVGWAFVVPRDPADPPTPPSCAPARSSRASSGPTGSPCLPSCRSRPCSRSIGGPYAPPGSALERCLRAARRDSARRAVANPPLTLSLIIPAYNQRERSIRAAATAMDFLQARFGERAELIMVDDGSVRGKALEPGDVPAPVTRIRHSQNLGKGGALRSGVAPARGEYVVLTDSDLPFSLEPLPTTLDWLREGADIV